MKSRLNRILALAFAILMVQIVAPGGSWIDEAEANSHPVHPGDRMVVGNAACTVAFVFDGQGSESGEVFMATAAHCVEAGVGASVQINGMSDFAEVEWVHPDWDGEDLATDMALLRVDSNHHNQVQADVRGHSQSPTGVTSPNEGSLGDVVQLSGHGTGFGFHPLTREERVGVVWSDTGNTYRIEAPLIFGDSGGPILHESTGEALGIVSAIMAGCCVGPGVWMEGPNVHHIIDEAADDGYDIELRTA